MLCCHQGPGDLIAVTDCKDIETPFHLLDGAIPGPTSGTDLGGHVTMTVPRPFDAGYYH
jgi:hypothetical protein